MKRFLLISLALLSIVGAKSQTTTVIWAEDFNNRSLWEASFPAAGWTIIDNDNDGRNWYYGFYEGDGYLLSKSYENNVALNPDNWIITPAIDLTTVQQNETLKFKWTVCPTANTPNYRTEHYGVFISVTNTQIQSFTKVYEETLTMTMQNWVFVAREIDLSQYRGQTIYIAFRHWLSPDKDRIAVNDFSLEKTTIVGIENDVKSAVSVYPNPATDYLVVTAPNLQKVEIYNAIGQLVLFSKGSEFDISNFNRGVYLVKIYYADQVAFRKIMVNK